MNSVFIVEDENGVMYKIFKDRETAQKFANDSNKAPHDNGLFNHLIVREHVLGRSIIHNLEFINENGKINEFVKLYCR